MNNSRRINRGFAHVFDGVNRSSSQGYKVPVWFAKEFL